MIWLLRWRRATPIGRGMPIARKKQQSRRDWICVGRYAAEALADAKCLLSSNPTLAFRRNATTTPRYVSQRNNRHVSRTRLVSHSSGMHSSRRQPSRHFARTSLSLRPRCIPAYTYRIPNGIMPLIAFAANDTLAITFSVRSACRVPTVVFAAVWHIHFLRGYVAPRLLPLSRSRRVRTPDLRFWRPTFCQLNYTPMCVEWTLVESNHILRIFSPAHTPSLPSVQSGGGGIRTRNLMLRRHLL